MERIIIAKAIDCRRWLDANVLVEHELHESNESFYNCAKALDESHELAGAVVWQQKIHGKIMVIHGNYTLKKYVIQLSGGSYS